jgi:hypothetical protein
MTKARRYKAPNGIEISGTSEILPATALIDSINDDGTPNYAGESKLWWDDQKTKTRDGKILFVDESGEEWTFDQLTPIQEEGE